MDHKREHRTLPLAGVMGVGRQQQHVVSSKILKFVDDTNNSASISSVKG